MGQLALQLARRSQRDDIDGDGWAAKVSTQSVVRRVSSYIAIQLSDHVANKYRVEHDAESMVFLKILLQCCYTSVRVMGHRVAKSTHATLL